MMCPDHGAIDHVGSDIAPCQFGQRLEHGIEHAGRDPSSIPPEDAVPLAILVRQMPPLRTGPGNPPHALEIAAIILCRAAATAALSRQQRPDTRPLLIRYTDPPANSSLKQVALHQTPTPRSS